MLLKAKNKTYPLGIPMRFERILLTGFRATGKSLVGQQLADRRDMGFIDTDVLLCQQFGCSVTEYVNKNNWDTFRQQENILLQDLSKREGVVIATGGGAIVHEQSWRLLRRQSFCVWLQADGKTILERLGGDVNSEHQRPSLTGQDQRREVQSLLAERMPLYRRGSDVGIATDDHTPEELVNIIEQHLAAGLLKK
jgi:shikimate kinase